jgi:DNA-binding response OmpR family regulator
MFPSALIVDGDPDSLDQICSIVAECDVRLQTATDLASAMKRISESRFSIILLDWQLPDEQASKLVRNVRDNHRLRRMHIIALSEPADPATVQSVLKSGVDDFFSRPIAPNELRTRLLWAQSRLKELV